MGAPNNQGATIDDKLRKQSGRLGQGPALGRRSGAAAVLTACGGGGGGSSAGNGALRVALTDAPSCGYDHVWVTVEKVRVHQSASAAIPTAVGAELALSPARRIDLLDLTNGVMEELGTTQLAAGHYSQIRLVLASNTGTGASSVANAVQPTGGDGSRWTRPAASKAA